MRESSENHENNNGSAYADIVIVPVANPATARHLLRMGLAMTKPEEGRVIALTVTLGDPEKESETLEEIEPICDDFTEAGHPVELQTRTAPNIARGILDAAREENADLIVLGLSKPKHGEVELGPIAESVATTAPCDVLIYRAGLNGEDFERIVVPANGSDHSRIAARVAALLGEGYDIPVEAMYVQSSERAYWEGRGRIEEALDGVHGAQRIKRTLITARVPSSGILSRVTEHDLLVVGYMRTNDMQRWLHGDFSRELLNRAPGPVVLTAQLVEPEADDALHLRLWRWLRPILTRVEQDDLVRQAQNMSSASLDYTVLIVISAILASFGLLTSSAAVIIGAMLVAPLMSPLIAFSVGVTTGRVRLVRRSALTVVQGFVLAFILALLVGGISPTKIVTPEMAGRGNPTVLDMGIALASGIIGAYATARKEIPAALAGVAIAAALMPPVCTIALGVAYGDAALARGAALLFTTNIISIIVAAWIVFFWLGMRPQMIEESHVRQYTSAALVVLFVGLMGLFLLRDVNPSTFEAGVERELRNVFDNDELIDFEVRRSDPLQVIATVRRASSRVDDNSEVIAAQRALQSALGQPVELDVVIEPYINADAVLARQVIDAALAPVTVEDVWLQNEANALLVTVVLEADDLAAVLEQLEPLNSALSQALDRSVHLSFETPDNDVSLPGTGVIIPDATEEAEEAAE